MNNSTIKVVLSVLVMLAFISTSACTSSSYERIHLSPETVQQFIEPGDMVKVTKIDGRELKFRANTITSKSISGNDDEPVLFSEIDKIEKKYKNKSKKRSGLKWFELILLPARMIKF